MSIPGVLSQEQFWTQFQSRAILAVQASLEKALETQFDMSA